MTRLLHNLWADESGFILTSELVLVGTIVVLGLTAALVCLRDAISGEVTEVARAFRSLDQSFCYSGMHSYKNPCEMKSWTAGSSYGCSEVATEVMECIPESICPPAAPLDESPCHSAPCASNPSPCSRCGGTGCGAGPCVAAAPACPTLEAPCLPEPVADCPSATSDYPELLPGRIAPAPLGNLRPLGAKYGPPPPPLPPGTPTSQPLVW